MKILLQEQDPGKLVCRPEKHENWLSTPNCRFKIENANTAQQNIDLPKEVRKIILSPRVTSKAVITCPSSEFSALVLTDPPSEKPCLTSTLAEFSSDGRLRQEHMLRYFVFLIASLLFLVIFWGRDLIPFCLPGFDPLTPLEKNCLNQWDGQLCCSDDWQGKQNSVCRLVVQPLIGVVNTYGCDTDSTPSCFEVAG